MEVHIRLRSLSKRFGDTLAVNDLNLEVEKGSFITLLGPSGCGKTTTLRLIAGFTHPDQGEIYLGDKLLNKIPAHKRGVAMVFQSYALFPHMNVFNNVAYGLKLRKMSKEEIRKKVKKVLSLLDMEGMENRWPGQLSGGQQQRIAVARALALEPEALLMDEPLSNLDAKLRISVRNEIKELQRRLGITTIYVTHDQEEALSMSDKVAVMKDGRLQQVATPWEIYNHPVNQFVADFIGAANFLEGTIVNLSFNKIEFAVDNQRFVMRNQNYNLTLGQKILVNVRPESIKISKVRPEGNIDNLIRGHISRYSYLGQIVRYWVEVGEGRKLIVEEHDPQRIISGEVFLTFDNSRLHLIQT